MEGRNQWKICSKETVAEERNKSPLERHIEYFGGVKKNQPISVLSIAKKNQDLGDSACAAYTNAVIVSGAGGHQINRCPFSLFTAADAISVLNHPNHTGIYKQNGEIDEDIWKELCTYAVDTEFDHGTERIISKSQFEKFLEARRKTENNPDAFSKAVSNGEWRKYWQVFGKNLSSTEKYVKLNDLRTFYEDSSIPGIEVEHNIKFGM